MSGGMDTKRGHGPYGMNPTKPNPEAGLSEEELSRIERWASDARAGRRLDEFPSINMALRLIAEVRRSRSSPQALEIERLRGALEPFAKAAKAYFASYRGFMNTGMTLADQRAQERERECTAMETAIGLLTFDHLSAAHEALASPARGD